jgi:hypothetical protein
MSPSAQGYNLVPGKYKYGDLAFEVGEVSNEAAKYGREFCKISTQRVTALARS